MKYPRYRVYEIGFVYKVLGVAQVRPAIDIHSEAEA